MVISYFLCVAIPLVIVNLFSSVNSRKTLKDTSSQLATEMIEQACANISTYAEEMGKFSNRIIVNELNATGYNLMDQYSTLGKKGTEGRLAKHNLQTNIRNQLLYSLALDNTIKEITLIFNDDQDIIMTSDPSSRKEYLSEEEVLGFLEYEQGNSIQWITDFPGYEGYIFITRQLHNVKKGKVLGVFIAESNISSLEEQIKNIELFDGSDVFLLDQNGQVLCSTEGAVLNEEVKAFSLGEAEVAEKEINGKLITYATSTNGWKVVAEIPIEVLTQAIDKVNYFNWILIIVSVIIAVAAGYMISQSIVIFIDKMRKIMKEAETGDLNVRVEVKTGDELGELGESFNHMVDNIKELVKETQSTIDNVLNASSILKRNTGHSIETFNQLTLSIENIAEGSNSQAEDTQNGAAMMETLSESIRAVMQDTKEVYVQSEGTRNKIEEASDNMERLNRAMDSTTAISAEISEKIISLNELTRTIGEVMKLLDDISEQTNLLALNASIEAARAGEVGRGFAVVANEVRNLAEQSKNSTNNVRSTLNEIELAASQAVELVKQSGEFFVAQEQAAEETKKSLSEMIEELMMINKGINQVSERSNSMDELKNHVGEKIENITTVTEENAAAAQELNALGEEQKAVMEQLSHLADELNTQLEGLSGTINQFKI
ncbi:MAG: methyl-accepting chemotaxis protein [Cellulosilyticum sp.]|nr:methyl-accepting chemotaxis protein [Cellulosilyticum sp.]